MVLWGFKYEFEKMAWHPYQQLAKNVIWLVQILFTAKHLHPESYDTVWWCLTVL